MEEFDQFYRKMHRAKIWMAISASLLIGSAFLAVFMGAYKITPGMEDRSYANYENFSIPVPARDGESYQIIAYSNRYINIYMDERAQGANDQASVVRFDMPTGELVWNFSGPEPSMNVGYVENVNEWYNGISDEPALLVQFAKVESTETTFSESLDQNIVFRNETGTYRTYIWNLGAPAFSGSTTEVTASIADPTARVKGIIRLPYDPSDGLADYILVTTNRSWQKEKMQLPVESGESILYSMFAMHANGSLAWKTTSNMNDSIIDFGSDTMLWSNIHGFPFNSTHFVLQRPDQKVCVASIATGNMTWIANDVLQTIEFPCDHSGDGFPDLVCNNNSKYIVCLNGKNGSVVSSFMGIDLSSSEGVSIRTASRFGTPFDLFMVRDDVAHRLRAYRHDATGVSILWDVDQEGLDIYSWDKPWTYLSNYTGTPLFLIHLGPPGGGNDNTYWILDIITGENVGEVLRAREISFVGDYFDEWSGVEVITVESDRGYFVIAASMKAMAMFELDPTNAIMFYAALIVGLLSVLALIRAKKTHSNLSRQEEEMQPDLATRKHEVTTTAKTTKPLRSLSLVMLVIILAATILFVTYIIVIGTGDNYMNSENYYAIRNSYITISLTFVSLPVIAILYNHMSPRSAMLYVKIQRFFFKVFFRGKKEYRVVVLDMSDYGKKHSVGLVISRSLFPLLVSLTLGLTIFGALATDTTGLGGTSGSINLVWLSEFELYGGLTFIGTYFLMLFISPGGWLLDDCGVVYFEQHKDVLHPGDISKISDWLTGWLKGFFGFTALLNYYNLFAGTDFGTLVNMDDPFMALILVVFVFMIMLVLSPILYGLIAMFSSNASMIDDLELNRKRLFTMLQKAGVDVTPKRLKDFFERT